MPSDSYHSFFTPSSNSISTIPQAYEYHPLCSNAASPCEEKSHFGKLGTEGAEVVVHTSTGGPPVSCRDLIVLTFIAAILMGMTLAFLVTLWFFLEQIECTSEGNCKNRHAPFTWGTKEAVIIHSRIHWHAFSWPFSVGRQILCWIIDRSVVVNLASLFL